MKTCRKNPRSAFTLIELLVVIAIIAILAAVSFPALNGAMMQGKIAAATNSARQVGLGLRMYAQDNSGSYPNGHELKTSNDAFRELVPDYLQAETVFAVNGSPAGRHADNRIEPESRVLEPGENHWAYVAGLNDGSNAMWPLIVDHTDGSGNYTRTEGQRGGTWKGTKTIVIRCDSSATTVKLSGSSSKRYLPRHDSDDQNALEVREYMGSEARLLEPAG
jgi:prepilin-type N-terminal cleavage/methylation domain-containing protein